MKESSRGATGRMGEGACLEWECWESDGTVFRQCWEEGCMSGEWVLWRWGKRQAVRELRSRELGRC